MAGKLSFSIAINLLTENFKRGTSSVKNAFRSMQAQILTFAAAMGFAGVSLSNFFSQLIQVARETSKAVTALKNVSGSTAQFADNLRYTTQLAQKYGVYVNDITSNYAKFTAAASIAGMAIADQRKLFESLSRAAAGFGMSADDTNGMFLAVTQMMGKGKIQAEELRGQLGERLPIAMQAMAKAAGTTVAGLDSIMKKGKLLSAEVLPKFADALNEMLPNVDTDNIETSLNRLKNAFQEFTQNTGIQDAYKKLIDSITGLVQKATKNIQALVAQLVAVLIGVSLGRFIKWLVVQWSVSERAAKIAFSNMAKAAGEKFNEVEWSTKKTSASMTMMFARSIKAIRVAFMSMLPTAIFTGLAMLIAKIVEARNEAKRINNIFSDYRKSSLSVPGVAESETLQQLYRIAVNVNEAYNIRKNALDQINEKLGTSFSIDQKNLTIQGDINKVIAQRIKLLEAQAAADYFVPQKIQAQDNIDKIYSQYDGGQKQLEKLAKFYLKNYSPRWKISEEPQALKDYRSVLQNQKIVNDADSKIQGYTRDSLSVAPISSEPEKSKKKTDLQKAEESYAKSTKELTNKLDNRTITETEYDRELKKLNKATYETLSGLLTPEQAEKNKTFQVAKAGAPTGKTYEAETAYWDEMNKLSGQYAENYITEKDYAKAKLDLTEKTLKEISGIEDIGEAGKAFVNALNESADSLRKEVFKVPAYKERDKTYDYKKTDIGKLQAERDSKRSYADKLKGKIGGDTDELEEKLKAAKGNLDAIKAEYGKNAEEFIVALNEALNNVTSLEDALKIAQVKKDVKDLSKELKDGMYSGVKEIASSSDRLVSAFSSLHDVFDDEDASAWERIMAVWNAMINTVDAFMSIIKTIETLTAITEKLGKAKEKETKLDTEKIAVSTANATAIMGEAAANIALAESIKLLKEVKGEESEKDEESTQSQIANNALKIASDKITTSQSISLDAQEVTSKKKTAGQNIMANTAEAASEAGASAAKLPFPANLIAIGGAIAGVLALFSALPKFANGGIIQGKPTGDLNLARVNGGEMILNGSQQATLFQLANGKGLKTNGTSISGELRAQGTELIAVIKSTERKIGRGR
ncbi:tape measure protein [Parabacteroides goldsteinii]|jgi:tape measure domain-containing protein|uniref:tape measure protein n=1 Tax=Parabacteroides goldsteinii TaxID=328812 RepID=UPI002061EA33|nr:tape measure protein [Parabacteroides goldsteinii]DAT74210.1 MAG TPA: Tail tape measure [Caudoviricetes sp.]